MNRPPCYAVAQPGTRVTGYIAGIIVIAIAWPEDDFVCGQDAGHPGGHIAYDPQGAVLARWSRQDTEKYWHPRECAGHAHG